MSRTARLALDAEGNFLALDVATIANLGAYMSGGGPGSSTNAPAKAMGGGYVIPAISMDVRAAFTNTVPIDAYRGAGKPEANYLIERLIDLAARQCGFDPVELRRRNMIASFPYRKALGTLVDCGRFAANIDDALALADRAGFAARRAATRKRGRLRGFGVACFLETARGAPNEGAEIRFHDDDTVALLVGTQSNGQGHETTYPQIAADLLGLPLDKFRYIQADTRKCPGRQRPWRGAVDAHGRRGVVPCRRGRHRQRQADRRQTVAGETGEVAFEDGEFIVGEPLGRSFVRRPRCPRPASADHLDTYVWNLLDVITIPNGCHIAEVEIDPETGLVTLDRYHGRRRFRRPDQSDADDRPGAGRPGAGHRPGDA